MPWKKVDADTFVRAEETEMERVRISELQERIRMLQEEAKRLIDLVAELRKL